METKKIILSSSLIHGQEGVNLKLYKALKHFDDGEENETIYIIELHFNNGGVSQHIFARTITRIRHIFFLLLSETISHPMSISRFFPKPKTA